MICFFNQDMAKQNLFDYIFFKLLFYSRLKNFFFLPLPMIVDTYLVDRLGVLKKTV